MKAFIAFLLGIIGIVHPVTVSNPQATSTPIVATSTISVATIISPSASTSIKVSKPAVPAPKSPIIVAPVVVATTPTKIDSSPVTAQTQQTSPQKSDSEPLVHPKSVEVVKYDTSVTSSSISSDDIDAASKATGVPTDFLLSILQRASNTSGNTNSCYLSDLKTGSLTGGGTMKIQDIGAFLQITSAVGIDPKEAAVSCQGGMVGLGFIPRTWVSVSTSRAPGGSGGSILNPWKPRDVALEIAFFLGNAGGSLNNGYVVGGFNKIAACKAWSGSLTGCSL